MQDGPGIVWEYGKCRESVVCEANASPEAPESVFSFLFSVDLGVEF